MADQKPEPKRIFLWVCPRSLSTVLEKCITCMDDSMVWHEPYGTLYFKRVLEYPKLFERFPLMKNFIAGFERDIAVIDSMKGQYNNLETSTKFTYEYLAEQLVKPLDEGKKFLVIKDLAIGIDGNYDKLPKGNFQHTFMIRNPNRQALSLRTLLKHLYEWEGDINDLQIGKGEHPFMSWDMLSPDPLYRLWNHVREHIDPNPVLIDADDLQHHPEVLQKYCEAVGIPWKAKYLTWDSSDEWLKQIHGSVEDIVWSKKEGIMKRGAESSKFEPASGPPPENVPAACAGYADELWEGYKVMYEHRLKPDVN